MLIVAGLDGVLDRLERRREQLELECFSDRELKDIGLARHQVEQVFDLTLGRRTCL